MEFPLKIYSITSAVCLVVDCVATIVALAGCGRQEVPGVYVMQLLIVTVYFYTDIFLFLYGLLFTVKLPVSLRRSVLQALVGWGNSLRMQQGWQ